MNKLRKGIKRIVVACFAVLIVTGTSKVVKAYAAEAAADLSVTIDTGSVILKDTDGDGAYEISNANELYAFAAAVNGGNTAINGELTANITVNTGVLVDGELANDTSDFREWTPIGNSNNKYTGTFNGNDRTVSGLYFNNSSTKYVGLFGYVSGGTVQKVGVVDSYFKGDDYVGGVVGNNNGGTVTDCYNTGTISGSYYVGGVAGHNINTVTDCYNTGTISGNNDVGGVAGVNSGTIENCYNEGTVRSSKYFAGGVVGTNKGTITDCYNTGTISGSSSFGDVVGSNLKTIENCYYLAGSETDYVADGTTAKNAEQFTSGEVAYLLGEAWGQILEGENRQSSPVPGGKRVYETSNCQGDIGYSNTEGQVVHSYENGYCTLCDSIETPEGSGNAESPYLIDNAGKLYWFASQVNGGNISIHGKLTENIVVNQNVLMADGTLNEGTFREWIPIGNSFYKSYKGIFNGNGKTVSGLYFNNSSSDYVGLFGSIQLGTVQKVGVVDSYFSGNERVGGVVGSTNGFVENCYYTGTISGNYEVGGVVGYLTYGTVTKCYNIGNVSGSNYVGCVVGDSSKSTVTNCYYLADSETDDVDGTTAKTAAQFASGEVAYLLGEAWGQILEGENCQNFPVLDGESVYPVYNCKNEIVDYSNTNQPNLHITYNNGFCTLCDSYEIPEGSGTEESPYLIDNAGKLYWFAARVNDGNYSTHGKLTANIVVNENVLAEMAKETPDVSGFRTWTPIGNFMKYYSGTFNGNGKTVSGLYLNNSSINNVGLFGYVQSGTVQKVGVVDSYISGNENVGGVVGNMMAGTVENCYNTGTVNGSSNIGCLVGKNNGNVKNCYNTGNVSGSSNVGGVVGYNYEVVKNCYNTGNVSGSSNVGEVVGYRYNTDTVTNCYYLADSETDAINGISAKTMAQFSSGEVAYLLGKNFGQILEGDNRQNYPVPDGTMVYYGYVSCADDAELVYTNNSSANVKKHSKIDEDKDGLCDSNGCNTIMDGIAGVSGNSLSLNGDVRVNFYMELDASITSNASAVVRFTVNGKTTDVPVSGKSPETDGSYKFSIDVAAAQMADKITVQVITSQATGTAFTYSVTEYAKAILEDAKYEDTTAPLMKAMLNYGTYAQHYFKYNKSLLANSVMENEADKNLTAITSATLNEFAFVMEGTLPEGVTYTGSTLLLQSKVTIRHYFTVADGKELPAVSTGWSDWKQKGSEYYTEMSGIVAAELHEMKELSLGTWNLKYSALSYAKLVLEKDASVLREGSHDLMTALYHYNRAAVTYFENK